MFKTSIGILFSVLCAACSLSDKGFDVARVASDETVDGETLFIDGEKATAFMEILTVAEAQGSKDFATSDGSLRVRCARASATCAFVGDVVYDAAIGASITIYDEAAEQFASVLDLPVDSDGAKTFVAEAEVTTVVTCSQGLRASCSMTVLESQSPGEQGCVGQNLARLCVEAKNLAAQLSIDASQAYCDDDVDEAEFSMYIPAAVATSPSRRIGVGVSVDASVGCRALELYL